jgi:low temperature requirement protein LtrA
MFAVAGLASAVPNALHGGQNSFAVAYVCVRTILLVLYVRVYRDVEAARAIAGWFILGFGVAVGIWVVSLAVPVPWKYLLWAVALAIEYTTPIRAWRLFRGTPVDPRHLPERFGLLVIIVLGEGVIGVVLGTAQVSWTFQSGAVAFAGFLTGAAIWWLYFDFLDTTRVVTRNLRSGLTFVYAHYFVAAGITGLGVGVELAILSLEPGSRYDHVGWIAAAGTAMSMAALAAVEIATPPMLVDADSVLRLAVAVLAGVLAGLSGHLSPAAVISILAVALVAQVVIELARHEQHTAMAGPF